jgi:hypothetical protein
MKATIKVMKEVEIKYLKMCISVDDDCKYPDAKNEMLTLSIEVDTGKILNYPLTESFHLFEKVTDRGSYYLYDEDFNEVLSIENNYVPNRLIPGSYGDYVDLEIDEKGIITNWRKPPDISDFIQDED